MDTGVCCNATCPKAGEPVERYPGPGQYCPECGELLAAAPRSGAPEPLTQAAYDAFQARMQSALEPAASPSPWPKRAAIAAVCVLAVVAAIVAALRTSAPGRAGSNPLAICPSSITQRLANDLVQAYAVKSGTPPSRFNVASTGACDVRFAAVASAAADAVAHDGVVAVVNPQNPIAAVSEEQVRGIVSGRITDWSQVGAAPGAIAVLVPDEGTDEARALRATLLHDTPVAARALRPRSSLEIVRTVASASGRRTFGIVAFSAAVPAKVLALQAAPVPSVLSIADHRYPISLAVTVEPQGGRADPAAAALVRYARSDEAQSIVVRDGLVAKKGY